MPDQQVRTTTHQHALCRCTHMTWYTESLFGESLLGDPRPVHDLQAAPVHINLMGLQRWLGGKNVQAASLRAEYLFSKLDTDASGFVEVPE
jgi:hypothetical protein